MSNLRPIYPGVPPKTSPSSKASSKAPTTANTSAAPSEGGTAAPSAAGSRPTSAASSARTKTSHHNGEEREEEEEWGHEDGASSMGGESYHSGGDDQDEEVPVEERQVEGDVSGNDEQRTDEVSPEEGSNAAEGAAADDPDDLERMLAELDEVTPEEMAAEVARMKKREEDRLAAEKAAVRALEQVKKIHLPAANAYMDAGNAFAYLYRKGFELQNKQLFDVVQDRISQLALHIESQSSNPEDLATHENDAVNHELDSILSLLDLQKVGVTNFLLNSMCFPKSAMSDKLEWSAWLSLLEAWKNCLIHDLNQLQKFRIVAGLIKPEDTSGKKKKHMTAEQEKAILDKEKVVAAG